MTGIQTKCKSLIKVTSHDVDEDAEEVVEDKDLETSAAAETNDGHET